MNYNYIYFNLQKLLQAALGPIDVAWQELQHALKNKARADCLFFVYFLEFFKYFYCQSYSQIFKYCMYK